jgi:hypothetical protein
MGQKRHAKGVPLGTGAGADNGPGTGRVSIRRKGKINQDRLQRSNPWREE